MNKELLGIITKLEILAAQYDAEGKRAGIIGAVPSSTFWQQVIPSVSALKLLRRVLVAGLA